jgi:hypothetical protein
VVAFEMEGRRIRIDLPLPHEDDFELTPTGLLRTDNSRRDAYEQEVRRRWRALLLVIKAKLEAIATGIATFDQEWLGYIETDSGETVGEIIIPQLEQPRGPLLLLPAARD